ncbi:hypothetical protein D3C71_1318070 [compost metagenome]
MAIRSPGASVSCRPHRTGRAAPGHWKCTSSQWTVAADASGCGDAGSSTEGGCSTMACRRAPAMRPDCSDCQARPMPAHSSIIATVRNTSPAAISGAIRCCSAACSASASIATRPSPASTPCSVDAAISRRRRRRSREATCLAATRTFNCQALPACSAARSAAPSSPSNAAVRNAARYAARSTSSLSCPLTPSHGTPIPISSASTASSSAADGRINAAEPTPTSVNAASASNGPMARTSRPSISPMSPSRRASRSPVRVAPSRAGASGSARRKNHTRRSRAMRRVASCPTSFSK